MNRRSAGSGSVRVARAAVDRALAGPNGADDARFDAAQKSLRGLLARPSWTTDEYVRAAVLREDLEYRLLRSDVGDALEPSGVQAARQWFLGEEVHRRLVDVLAASRLDDTRAEHARKVDLRRLRAVDAPGVESVERLAAAAQRVLAKVDDDRRRLVERLGVHRAPRPRAALASVLSRVTSAPVREKLWDAWSAAGAHHREQLVEAVEALVAAQRAAGSAPAGPDDTPADEAVDRFLRSYLARGVEESRRLERELAEAVPDAAQPLRHIDHVLRRVFAGKPAPRLPVTDYLAHAARHTRAELGVLLVVSDDAREVRVRSADGVVGDVMLDLWTGEPPSRTLGLRNRSRWPGLERTPVSHIRCGFRRAPGDAGTITVQQAHSLLHELGHALQHMLIVGDVPAVTGLEALPVERRESMALWLEKFLYRPGLPLPPEWRTVKALEARRGYVERGVLALVDRAVFGPSRSTVTAAFEFLEGTYGISHAVSLDDVLEHFAGPVSSARGGNYHQYAWGSAESCAAGLGPPQPEWLDPQMPSRVPDVEAVFAFYGDPRLGGRQDVL